MTADDAETRFLVFYPLFWLACYLIILQRVGHVHSFLPRAIPRGRKAPIGIAPLKWK